MGLLNDNLLLKFNVEEFNKYAYFETADGLPLSLPLEYQENTGQVVLTVDV